MIPLFAATLFVSAGLLFWVEPLFARMVLPLLGGSPSVWNTCLVFFQAVLLAGYLYAHAAARFLRPRAQAGLHLTLLTATLFALPLAVPAGWTPPASSNPVLWLLLLLLVSVGLPAFVLCGTTPLVQGWFARSGRPGSRDPYFLYSASNLGSMIALLAYPLLIEPRFSLGDQSRVWAAGFLLLGVLLAACATAAARARGGDAPGPAAATRAQSPPEAIPRSTRLRWLLLSFAPSSLLLGVTSHLTHDVAAVPLFWVVPLALYLLTFVIAFARRPGASHRWALAVQPVAVLAAGVVLGMDVEIARLTFPLHLLAFFATALVCHGELARSRPHAEHLTGFYLWISAGGVLGGLFNALLAPQVFSGVAEYPLVLVLALALRPSPDAGDREDRRRTLDAGLPLALFATLIALFLLLPAVLSGPGRLALAKLAILLAAAAAALACRRRPFRLALAAGALVLAGIVSSAPPDKILLKERNFFGVLKVTDDGRFHTLYHGKAIHGAQELDPRLRGEPLTYYTRRGPLGQLFAAYDARLEGQRVALVGLGAGSALAYGRPGQSFTCYEIDPAVERIARDPAYFTFLADARAPFEVVIGDARLKLAGAASRAYRLIVVDAFSSDAIPVHLLTREALRLYFDKLAPGGLLAFHVSNAFLDLRPVLAAQAAAGGWSGAVQNDEGRVSPAEREALRFASTWAVLARSGEDLAPLAASGLWQPLQARPGDRAWSDDYSNILGAFKRGR